MSIPAGYFDYAAATPLDTDVLLAMQPYLDGCFFNPSALYGPARESKQALTNARKLAAEIIGAKPVEVLFTAGASEANNLAIRGVMERYPDANIVISAIEHDSVSEPAAQYACRVAAVDERGLLQINDLVDRIDDQTVLVSVMMANNEVGTVQPIAKLAKEIEVIRKDRVKRSVTMPLYLHTDAVQAANYLDIHVHRLGVDMMTLNGGKIYGPKQSGMLYVASGVHLEPLIYGGGQERGLRSGTENLAQITGFVIALQKAQALRITEVDRIRILQTMFCDLLTKYIPAAKINGHKKYRLPNNVHITLEGVDNERLIMMLDEHGVYAAAGSACSASSDEPSHVLDAMGMNVDQIRGSLRFTMGRQTTAEDIEKLVPVLTQLLAET